VTDVVAIEPDGPAWTVTQALPRGGRRRLRVLPPAVLAVSAAAPVALRHALSAAMAGQILRTPAPAQPATSAADLRFTTDPQLVPRSRRLQVLEARTVQSGHARMLAAVESPATGGTVLRTGDPTSKAEAVLAYLRSHSLVPF
ncbi:MAG: electron transfer flavoprotein beta subunit, partial [Rhodoferax sp.]|nr:electron transfer flavoprotein beta subunit [Rhodoferax sp.]